jgi:alpha-mannosidase
VRGAWRALLPNQAHDSICGCSQDRVHEQMAARFDTAVELADQTTARVLERLAGLGPERRVPWSTELDVAVFNPSPFTRTDVVTIALVGFPVYRI